MGGRGGVGRESWHDETRHLLFGEQGLDMRDAEGSCQGFVARVSCFVEQ